MLELSVSCRVQRTGAPVLVARPTGGAAYDSNVDALSLSRGDTAKMSVFEISLVAG
jgi:hypothetical protein